MEDVIIYALGYETDQADQMLQMYMFTTRSNRELRWEQ
jgi:hypothetical protein